MGVTHIHMGEGRETSHKEAILMEGGRGGPACATCSVKDRVLGHNPVAALYTVEGYYSRMLRPGIDRKNAPE